MAAASKRSQTSGLPKFESDIVTACVPWKTCSSNIDGREYSGDNDRSCEPAGLLSPATSHRHSVLDFKLNHLSHVKAWDHLTSIRRLCQHDMRSLYVIRDPHAVQEGAPILQCIAQLPRFV